ncbi:hypothetical protein [Bacillus pseudomycoides]|uniref:hypothetical protein n=1 Tax=Bacillus pseudomycoides TaxID=64104 RepID=UPI00053532FA|nr:hypothetical protein [Bacillus pseudomycoides]
MNLQKKPYLAYTLLEIHGVPPAFLKKTTLRACKILYSFSANPVTNGNPGTHARIGMYKKMNIVIEKEKGRFLVRVGIPLVIATDNNALC